jgi:uncharacterized protein (DUF2147 family)
MRTAILAIALVASAAPAMAADPIEGEWLTPGGTSKVRISACPDKPVQMCGLITWLPAPKTKDLDKHNPNAALRMRPIMGVQTVLGFKRAGPGKWGGGKLYDPASGKTYDGTISGNSNGTLRVEGCVLMVCQAQTWTRA